MPIHAPTVEARAAILERNLAALTKSSPIVVERLRAVSSSDEIEFVETPDGGALAAVLHGRALASKRRPLEEARRLSESIDIKSAAVFAVMGFGVGHHAEAIGRKVGRSGIVLCFEPDVAMLRAVLERVDHSEWISQCNFALLIDEEDAASVSSLVHGMEALVAMGVRIVEHAASVERLGASSRTFGETLARVVAAVRTNVLTSMVQTETTVRNLVMNADRYIAAPGIDDLRGVLTGYPAVVVSAGPSLSRNIHELAKPGVRDKVCIVAVQTTLKPLLAAGVKPHFVVALDHHEISRRFYDGLTAEDVEGVTLVVEPKANPAILDAWPGAVRMPRDPFLDDLLGDGLTDAKRGAIRSGATVAHLAHYFARHLGCDPVALIGQDLGFTDGQYYAAGAAIHEVWACELNEFVSLELLEWQRIVRSRSMLRRAEDVLGRPIFTDEQMATYLAQFERNFLTDAQAGLRVVDATEGGVRKAHTTPMRLAAFLREFARAALPDIAMPAPSQTGTPSAERAAHRLREVRQGVWEVAHACRSAGSVLAQMIEHHLDKARVDRLIGEAHQLASDTALIQPAYKLVQRFNQTGIFNRARDDRTISLEDLDPFERQRRQMERDQRNLRWLGEAADAFGAILDAGASAMRTGDRVSRDVSRPAQRAEANDERSQTTATSVAAVVIVDTTHNALGHPRDLCNSHEQLSVLRRVIDRLSRCARLESINILTDEPDAVREMLKGSLPGLPIEIQRVSLDDYRRDRHWVRGARAWAGSCWRGGLGGMTVYDEAIDANLFASSLEATGTRAALVVGADWAAIDPLLCDEVIARHEEDPDNHRLVFTQAPPGLCGCVIDQALLREIADNRAKGAMLASIGGLLAYSPRKPRADAIAKPICVRVPAEVRDFQARFIADTPAGVALCGLAMGEAIGASELATRIARERTPVTSLSEVVLRIDDSTTANAVLASVADMIAPFAVTIDARAIRESCVVPEIISVLRANGASAAHLRINGADAARLAEQVIVARPEVISIDMHADSAEGYRAATGHDGFAEALTGLESLANLARDMHPAERPWIVPRMTKRDAIYSDLESFVDKWTLVFGHAAIDPFDGATASERVQPLPMPQSARSRFERERRTVDLRTGGQR
jgi:hypothetical protein